MAAPEETAPCLTCGAPCSADSDRCLHCGSAITSSTTAPFNLYPGPASLAPSEAGKALGRFDLIEVLGKGGFATVYRAMDTRLEREVALKLLRRDLAEDPAFLRRFESEARAMARLRHAHIVTIYEVGQTDSGQPCLVMELLSGRPLSGIIAERAPLDFDEAAPIIWQLGLALDYLHARGLIHRDLKPANIMVSDTGDVTLMDFGIARVLNEQADLTAQGQFVGTPVYMAPEQFDDGPIGPPVDIYALGILTYELFAGRPPFTGTTKAVIRAHIDTPPPPIQKFNPRVPTSVCRALDQALTKDPQARPATAAAFVEILSRPPEENSRLQITDPLRGITRIRRLVLRRPRLLALGTAALALFLAVVSWLLIVRPPADGRLLVDSAPTGADVRVDGAHVGLTPIEPLSLKPGVHTIMLEKPSYDAYQDRVSVRSNRTTPLRPRLRSLRPSQLLAATDSGIVLIGKGAENGAEPGSESITVQVASDRQGQVTVSLTNSGLQGNKAVYRVAAEEPFAMDVALAPRYPNERDLQFTYQLELRGEGGTLLQQGPTSSITIKKSDEKGVHIPLVPFMISKNQDGSSPKGFYRLSLIIEGEEITFTSIRVDRN